MNQHTRFNLPICLAVEEDAFFHSDEVIKTYIPEIWGKKTLIVSEQFLIDTYSAKINEISRDFCGAKIYAMKEATFDEAVAIAKKLCVGEFRVIIGFGGGRVLDTAKYAAHISKTVYICMPTSLSNDSLASPFSVLGTENSSRQTLTCKIPTAIIVDTNMIINAPEAQTLSGIGDTLSKYTALYDWKLSAQQSGTHIEDFAYALSWMSFDSVYHCDDKNMKSSVFIGILSRALVMGGLAMEIAGSSRPCSGSEHLFAHAIEEYFPEIKITHGIAVALGSIPACIFQDRDAASLINIMKLYGINIAPADYGITKDMFSEIWQRAYNVRPGRVTVLNGVTHDRKRLDDIYDRMTEAV